MGFFSKLGRLSSDIGSGISTGIGTGLQSLSNEYENQRQQRSSQRIRQQGALDSMGLTSPAGRSIYAGVTGANEGYLPILADEDLNPQIDVANQILASSDSQLLTGKGKRGGEAPAQDITIKSINSHISGLEKQRSALDNWFNTNKNALSSGQVSRVQKTIAELSAKKDELIGVYDQVILRDTDDPVLIDLQRQYGQVYNSIGYKNWAEVTSNLGGTDEYLEGKGQLQRLKVVQSLMGVSPTGGPQQPGGSRRALQFIEAHAAEDKSQLIEYVNAVRAQQELGVTRTFAQDIALKANSQSDFQQAYDLLGDLPQGVYKQNLTRRVINDSAALLEQRGILFEKERIRLADFYAETANKRISGQARLGGRVDALTYALQEGKDPETDPIVRTQVLRSPNDPDIWRMATEAAMVEFPEIARRNKYQRQAIGGLTIPDIVAMRSLQQMNIGMDASAAKQLIFTDDSLNQNERIKAIELFEEVGMSIGFDVISDDRNNAATLTQIHKGFPSWWNQKTKVEDRVFESNAKAFELQVQGLDPLGQRLSGGPVDPQLALDQARKTFENRELKGELPVGASKRLTDRLTMRFLPENVTFMQTPVGPVAQSGEAEDGGNAVLTASENVNERAEGDSEEKRFQDLKRQYVRILGSKPNLENLTREEQDIVSEYMELDNKRTSKYIGSGILTGAGYVDKAVMTLAGLD